MKVIDVQRLERERTVVIRQYCASPPKMINQDNFVNQDDFVMSAESFTADRKT